MHLLKIKIYIFKTGLGVFTNIIASQCMFFCEILAQIRRVCPILCPTYSNNLVLSCGKLIYADIESHPMTIEFKTSKTKNIFLFHSPGDI